MRLPLFIKETLTNATKAITSKKRLQELLGISLYRNSIYLMLNSGILAIFGFFFWMIAARLYPVEGIGLASAAISAMGLLALLSTLGLDYGLIRFLPNSREKANEVINTCLTIGSIVSITLSVIFLIGLHIWSPALLLLREHPIFLATFVAFTLVTTLMTFSCRAFLAKRRAGFVLAQGLIFGLARFIPLVFLATLFRTFGIFASWGIAMGVAAAVSILFFLPRVQTGYHPLVVIKKEVVSEISSFSLANYASNIFRMLPASILPIMAVNLLGAELSAYFYISWIVAGVVFMIPVATSFSLFAEGSDFEDKLKENVSRSFKFVFLLLIPAVILLLLFGKWLLLAFGQSYSANALTLLWILSISSLPLAVNHIYSSVLRVLGKLKELMAIWGFIAITTLLTSYLIMPMAGIIGIGYAWLGAQTIVALYVAAHFWLIHPTAK